MPAFSRTILVAFSDSLQLRGLCRLLQRLGFEVRPVRTVAALEAELATGEIELLLADQNVIPSADAFKAWLSDYPRLVSLVAASPGQKQNRWLEAGAVDCLASPLVAGELLTRLRCGVRLLELREKLHGCVTLGNQSALPGPARFMRTLSQALREQKQAAVALVELDGIRRFQSAHGHSLTAELASELAAEFAPSIRNSELLADLGNSRYAFLLFDQSELEAAAWGEQLAACIAETSLSVCPSHLAGAQPSAEVPQQWTLSIGIAATNFGSEDLYQQALAALEGARHSGGDCVCVWSEISAEIRGDDSARLLAASSAVDLMTPSPLLLRESESCQWAEKQLAECEMFAAPVVDEHGKATGLLFAEDAARGEAATAAEIMETSLTQVSRETKFAELVQIFSTDINATVLVAEHGAPLGLITGDSLATLTEPL